MAPEIIHKLPYDYRIDIWSIGILLYELFHKEPPFKGRNLTEITKSIHKTVITFLPSVPTDARDLILKILKNNYNNRLSFSQIFAHSWVKRNASSINEDITNKALDTTLNASKNFINNLESILPSKPSNFTDTTSLIELPSSSFISTIASTSTTNSINSLDVRTRMFSQAHTISVNSSQSSVISQSSALTGKYNMEKCLSNHPKSPNNFNALNCSNYGFSSPMSKVTTASLINFTSAHREKDGKEFLNYYNPEPKKIKQEQIHINTRNIEPNSFSNLTNLSGFYASPSAVKNNCYSQLKPSEFTIQYELSHSKRKAFEQSVLSTNLKSKVYNFVDQIGTTPAGAYSESEAFKVQEKDFNFSLERGKSRDHMKVVQIPLVSPVSTSKNISFDYNYKKIQREISLVNTVSTSNTITVDEYYKKVQRDMEETRYAHLNKVQLKFILGNLICL